MDTNAVQLLEKRTDTLTLLHEGVCEVKFTKSNGEERDMWCTLNPDLLPPKPEVNEDTKESKPKKKNEEVICAWDLEKEAWRSFRIDSLISIKKK